MKKMEIRVFHKNEWWLFPVLGEPFTEEELKPYVNLPFIQIYEGQTTKFFSPMEKSYALKLLEESKIVFEHMVNELNKGAVKLETNDGIQHGE